MTQATPSRSEDKATSLDAWRTFLSCTSIHNADIDADYLLGSLDALHQDLFSKRTQLFVSENREDTGNNVTPGFTSAALKSDTELETHLESGRPCMRLISIVRGNSLQPFRISSTSMLRVVEAHNIRRPFLDLLFGFRGRTEVSEKGCARWCASLEGDQAVLCYQLRYRERNFRSNGPDSWYERQIGIYHQFNRHARSKVESALENEPSGLLEAESYLKLHLLVLSSYIDNWRWYLDELGSDLLAEENKGFTDDLDSPSSATFPTLQKLRDQEAELAATSVALASTVHLIESIREFAEQILRPTAAESKPSSPVLQALEQCLLRCQGYHASVKVLEDRANKLIQLIADGLNHRNQNHNADISTSLYQLTKKSVDDNAVIRVVTIITLIYLPTQLVASFFGMNFTSFDQSSLVFAGNWWIFLAAALPLTFLTLFAVGIAIIVEEQRKRGDGSFLTFWARASRRRRSPSVASLTTKG